MRLSLPPSLATRIDRLSLRAHRFHRFAHHPLCLRYSGEVFSIGRRTRICRGCALVVVGLVVGLATGILAPTSSVRGFGSVLLGAGLIFSSRWIRLSKVASRFLPALLFGVALPSNFIAAAATILAATAFAVGYRAVGPNRMPCQACPERELAVCSGFKQIVRRERAFQRLVGRWLRHVHREQGVRPARLRPGA